MSRMNAAVVVVLAGVLLSPGLARAQVILMQRCTADGLSAVMATARVEWMRQCALSKLSPSDHVGGEYVEPTPDPWWGANSYVGPGYEFGINMSYIGLLYRSGFTTQSIDANGYYKWSKAAYLQKARPLYPTYGSQGDISNPGNLQLFPHPTLANCNFYFDRNGTQPANVSFYVNGYCESLASLTSGVPAQPLSGAAGSTQFYALEVPAGATRVVFETSGGTGDVDLYVRHGAAPDSATYDCRPFLGGNNEGCNMPSPAAGTWYVMLSGFSAYSGVTLKATISP